MCAGKEMKKAEQGYKRDRAAKLVLQIDKNF